VWKRELGQLNTPKRCANAFADFRSNVNSVCENGQPWLRLRADIAFLLNLSDVGANGDEIADIAMVPGHVLRDFLGRAWDGEKGTYAPSN
jgi:hypothetical protein